MSSHSRNKGEKTETTRTESNSRPSSRRSDWRAGNRFGQSAILQGEFKAEAPNGLSASRSPKTIESRLHIAGEVNGVGPKVKTKFQSAGFEDGLDFIPFVYGDGSDEETGTKNRRDTKGKGKAIEEDIGLDRQGPSRKKEETDREGGYRDVIELSCATDKSSRTFERDWDKGKRYPENDDSRRRNGRIDRDKERERDRNGSHKRKYNEYENDQTHEIKRQRSDAFSKKCPWMSGVDLEKCRNVAEM